MAKRRNTDVVRMEFYFRDRSTAAAFRDCVETLIKLGAKIAGNTEFFQATDARALKFAASEDVAEGGELQSVLLGEKRLRELISEADVSVRAVLLRNILSKTYGTSTNVKVESISAEASATDHHPVSIVGEGWIFSTPGYENQAKKAGAELYRTFTKLCAELDPHYATILNEDTLLCMHDLRIKRLSGMFGNFYLGSEVQAAGQVKTLFKDAYVEEIGKGCFFSMDGLYNPKKKYVEDYQAAIKMSEQTIDLLCGKRDIADA